MKRIININLSKDTPAETVTALYAAIKAGKEPKRKQAPLYLLNEDIEKLHARYEELFKQVKDSQNLSENQIEKECDVLSRKYDFELEELSQLRKVDYNKRQAEIKAREQEETPWRRCWLWRLIFQPLTNRAQDIIEERAKLNADEVHTAAEKANKDDRKRLESDEEKEPSKRELKQKTKAAIKAAEKAKKNDRKRSTPDDDKKPSKRELKRKLKATIKAADKADLNEAFNEPQPAADVPTEQGSLTTAAPIGDSKSETVQEQEQPKAQIKPLPRTSARRPRPPRSCR